MQLSKKPPITQVTSPNPPVKMTTLADGAVVKEKVAPQPYSRKFVTPSGTVAVIPMTTGHTISEGPHNSYGIQKMAERKARGNLLYSECPYATGWLIRPDGVQPCKGTHPSVTGAFWRKHPKDGRRYIEDQCCEHMEAIIAERRKAHNAKQREFAEEWIKQQRMTAGNPVAEPTAGRQVPRGATAEATAAPVVQAPAEPPPPIPVADDWGAPDEGDPIG